MRPGSDVLLLMSLAHLQTCVRSVLQDMTEVRVPDEDGPPPAHSFPHITHAHIRVMRSLSVDEIA